jgi:DNA-binding NarL/FixJ family response regulator
MIDSLVRNRRPGIRAAQQNSSEVDSKAPEMSESMKRFLLADSNTTLRSALALLLENRIEARVIGQVSSMESLLCEARATRPDIIIMEWELPGHPVHKRLEALRQISPPTAIIITSARPENARLEEKADAFLCKADPPDIILGSIQKVIEQLIQEGSDHV